uniref:G_PROTEIN_RECEP_F1_2 domain-containing protein n=1 Tax=Syphacia muris TaxID=451379 RepID=A0A0N5AFH7_9BILA
MWEYYFAVIVYSLTVQLGVIGNSWVICSVLRNRRPRSGVIRRSPSDRLRNYIFILAIVDFAVILTLLVRLLYIVHFLSYVFFYFCLIFFFFLNQNAIIYFAEHFAKFTSLSCLACISVERFIAIKKPFDSSVRKCLFKRTPYIAGIIIIVILIVMMLQMTTVGTTADHKECQLTAVLNGEKHAEKVFIGFIFFSLILFVSANYGQIIHHVRRKFLKRKARGNYTQRELAEPRYMKEMTSAILRVALFHLLCWLPFCIFQLLPNEISTLTAVSLRLFKKDKQDDNTSLHWAAFTINWLVYANSAANWIFYAVMNRDLRNLIRRNTERRKRSTLSQPSLPGRFSSSFRSHFPNNFKFLHSVSTKSQSSDVDEKSSLHLNALPSLNGNFKIPYSF